MAEHLQDLLPVLYAENQIEAPYRPDADQASKRDLSTAVLGLLSRIDGGAQAAQQYARADNMTLQLSALAGLLIAGKGEAELEAFQQQWKDDRLVMDKWFGLQVSHAAPARAAEVAERLTRHPDFTLTNPNRFRAVLGALGMNHAGFHHGSGKGYALVADKLIALDAKNPQTTARMCALFQTWRRYDASRQAHARAALERIAATPGSAATPPKWSPGCLPAPDADARLPAGPGRGRRVLAHQTAFCPAGLSSDRIRAICHEAVA